MVGTMAKIDDSVKKKVPELRFPGFTDDWEERKFADFIDVKSGKDYKHLNSGSIPVYGTGGYMLSVDRALSDIDAIGIGRKGTIDKPYLLKAPFWTVDTLFYAVPKQNIDLQFSLSIFKKINWKKFDESTGVPSLSKTVINSVGASVPSYEEQQKIGSFFQQLDETIALHQRKLDLLKEQKKGYLQKMFPKNGAKVPELRFAGFADAWEQRKLGDITTWTKGQGLSKEYLNNERYGSEAVHYADLYKFSPVMQEVIHWTNSDDGRIIPDNSLLFPASDVTPVGLARTSTLRLSGVKAGGDVIIGQLSERINSSFMSYQINANSKKILPLITGTTVRHVQAKSLATMSVTITNMAEQTAIAGLFERIDNLIALHQRKLDLLKEQKKGFLQKMFV
jgi:type I restriction enzyme S subunit